MKLLITRPVVLTGAGGVRSFVPGLKVDVDAPTAEQILAQQAGIAAAPSTETEAPAIHTSSERRLLSPTSP